ncbi:right-handed parallel beta-helix repeat-containing protein [Halorussus salinisoli]|uniref:right-handed parallel beta-helix repeat-containing protein n=1 Tax=Halorussus salinisoli TaxID=2558242 RepID=UPI001485B4A2|nr:right-handed parallel beta-helix repeat-containing protein [Halorussus salinisoli]
MSPQIRANATLLVVGILILGGLAPLAPAPTPPSTAAERPVESATEIDSCTTITTPGEYVLTANLESHIYTCLAVETSDVTIDGNGHTITVNATVRERGKHLVTSSPYHFGAGVAVGTRVTPTVRNVSVANLTVTGLDVGVQFVNVQTGTVQGVTATDNVAGIRLTDATDVTITATKATEHVEDGISVATVTGIRITDTNASDNGYAGIALVDTTRSGVHNTTTAGNFGDGIVVRNASRVTLTGVTAARNTVGVLLFDATATTVTGSRIDRNAFVGLALANAAHNVISETVVSNTTATKSLLDAPSGIWLFNATRNRFEDVHAIDNRDWAVYARNQSRANSFTNLWVEGLVAPSFTAGNLTNASVTSHQRITSPGTAWRDNPVGTGGSHLVQTVRGGHTQYDVHSGPSKSLRSRVRTPGK